MCVLVCCLRLFKTVLSCKYLNGFVAIMLVFLSQSVKSGSGSSSWFLREFLKNCMYIYGSSVDADSCAARAPVSKKRVNTFLIFSNDIVYFHFCVSNAIVRIALGACVCQHDSSCLHSNAVVNRGVDILVDMWSVWRIRRDTWLDLNDIKTPIHNYKLCYHHDIGILGGSVLQSRSGAHFD